MCVYVLNIGILSSVILFGDYFCLEAKIILKYFLRHGKSIFAYYKSSDYLLVSSDVELKMTIFQTIWDFSLDYLVIVFFKYYLFLDD